MPNHETSPETAIYGNYVIVFEVTRSLGIVQIDGDHWESTLDNSFLSQELKDFFRGLFRYRVVTGIGVNDTVILMQLAQRSPRNGEPINIYNAFDLFRQAIVRLTRTEIVEDPWEHMPRRMYRWGEGFELGRAGRAMALIMIALSNRP